MKLGIIQFEQCLDIKTNINRVLQYKNVDADVLVFPESALTGYRADERHSISLNHEGIEMLRTMPQDLMIGAHIDENISYLHIADEVFRYNKCHLGLKEQMVYTPGNELRVFDVKGVKIGVALCIECHIPDISSTLRLMGAEIIIMPFASPGVCGNRYDLWSKYLPARAYDNGVYVIACNLTGNKFSGGILIYDYLGNEIMSHFEKTPCIKTIKLDIDALRKRRLKRKTNYIERRRPELYRKE